MQKFDDRELELKMGRLLQAGVIGAAALMLIGGVLYLVQAQGHVPDYQHFHASPQSFRSIPHIFLEAARGDAAALIQTGTLLMIATPVARVIFAIFAFAREYDRLYVAISLIVLALLVYGLMFGR